MKNPFKSPWSQNFFQKHKKKLLVVQALIFAVIGYAVARGFSETPAANADTHDHATSTAKAVSGPSLWTCSMHPQIRQPNPGSCPICGMDLIPVPTSAGGMRTLRVSPETRALMNIATTPVVRKYVSHEIPLVGKVDYDETNKGYITAWVPGRLDRLYVDYTGIQVNPTSPVVDVSCCGVTVGPAIFSLHFGSVYFFGKRTPR